jgi:hypothetical protein
MSDGSKSKFSLALLIKDRPEEILKVTEALNYQQGREFSESMFSFSSNNFYEYTE